jgi:hypothetical protein
MVVVLLLEREAAVGLQEAEHVDASGGRRRAPAAPIGAVHGDRQRVAAGRCCTTSGSAV